MADKKPNILILWGDDIGIWNISYFSRGQMGYRTPNIDRVANEGVAFTDYYAQQSCTAGRAAFITGQNPVRTGLTKVGMPGATVGLQAEDPTIAELLKPLGYATGQFGKNHLGDRDEYLPTVHGFDEFFGNLYHLNAEEEPELPDYPKDPAFKKKFGPRGVLHCTSDGKGGQKIEDTGPLTKKRMETIDEEITSKAIDWMEKQAKADKPFFLWYNSTAMHFRTHLADKNRGKSGQDDYSDRMVDARRADRPDARQARRAGHRRQHHRHVLDRQRPRERHLAGRRQHAVPQPEGHQLGRRLARPGVHPLARQDQARHGPERHRVPPGHAADAAGRSPAIRTSTRSCSSGYKAGDKTFKVHIDGYNMLPYLTGQAKESPRNSFFYMSDDGDVMAVRTGDWKFVLGEQTRRPDAGLDGAARKLRVPLHLQPAARSVRARPVQLEHLLRLDGRATPSCCTRCRRWWPRRSRTSSKYPPRQKPASFNLDAVMRQVTAHHR